MLVGPSPGSGWGCGGGEALQAGDSWEESSGSLEETSAVQPAAWPSPFYKAQEKKAIEGGKGKGQAPAGVVGIPVASNLARRVGDLLPESGISGEGSP